MLRKGDGKAGAVLVKVVHRRKGLARLFAEAVRGDGERVWMQPSLKAKTEAELDGYIARAVQIDPDLWIIEIDDAQGRHFLTEPVEA